MCRAKRNKVRTCAVYALVLATEISGPAWVKSTRSHSRAMLEPTTFTIPSVRMRRDLHSLSAARESAVSPLWLTKIASERGESTGSP
jgi:hypothetical protein